MAHYGDGEPIRTETGLVLEPCDCCGEPQPSGRLRSEPPSDLFPRGRKLCGTCFNRCVLGAGHRVLSRR